MSVNKCANCERIIGNLEVGHLCNDHVVCEECSKKLGKEEPKPKQNDLLSKIARTLLFLVFLMILSASILIVWNWMGSKPTVSPEPSITTYNVEKTNQEVEVVLTPHEISICALIVEVIKSYPEIRENVFEEVSKSGNIPDIKKYNSYTSLLLTLGKIDIREFGLLDNFQKLPFERRKKIASLALDYYYGRI